MPPASRSRSRRGELSKTPSAAPKQPPPKLLFIHASQPDDATSPANLSAIRAHAKRDVHAKARQRRMIEYQNAKDDGRSSQGGDAPETAPEQKVLTVPSPTRIVSGGKRDPFGASVMPPTPFEQNLLDLCELPTYQLFLSASS